MANMPDVQVPSQSSTDFHAAQLSHQGHQGWHPHMTQSLGACALQTSLQAAIPPQQSPPKVGTPVKSFKDFVFTHAHFGV
jgi:hypothetical protein